MAEALATVAVVSSIVQLVDFGSKLTARLQEFQSTLEDTPKTFQQIKVDVALLLDVLTKTKEAIDAGRVTQATANVLVPVVTGCREQIESLDAILLKTLPEKGDSRTKRSLKAVSSALKDDKVDRINSSIQKHIQSLTLYYAAASQTLNPERDKTLIKIRRWLAAPDPSLNYQKALKVHLKNTGLWFLESKHYKEWKTNTASFLWLHGKAGCGKTILSSTVIKDILEDCRDDPIKVIGYYYFAFNDFRKQSAELMVKSLITQLSERYIGVPKALQSLYASCEDGARQPSVYALLEALRQMIQGFGETFIVLDALDECNDRAEFWDILDTMVSWQIGNLHFVATSRAEPDIRESIEDLVCRYTSICLQSKKVDEDIYDYILHRLTHDKGLQRWRSHPDVQQDIKAVLTEKSCGMWRWVACQLDALGKCLNRSMLRKSLQSLPRTLEETYDRILCAIDDDYHAYAFCILQWLAFSARPLRVQEAAETVAITFDDAPIFDKDQVLPDPSDLLRICSSLVTIVTSSKTQEQHLTLAHYSVKEYLVSENIQKSPAAAFAIQERVANRFIAEGCLVYILQFQGPDCLSKNALDTYKLADYAARFWIDHTHMAGEDTKTIYQLISRLFARTDDAYINWLRIWNPDSKWNKFDSTRTMEKFPGPLYYASLTGLTETVELLVNDELINTETKNGHYGNVLEAASSGGHRKIAGMLLAAGANVNARSGSITTTALGAAVDSDREEVVELLLAAGADVNARTRLNYVTALAAAADRGCKKVVERLLMTGAIKDLEKALLAASFRGHDDVVALIVDAGADINARINGFNNVSETPLMAASGRGRKEIVERLLAMGANAELEVALVHASYFGYEEVAELILKAGADPNGQVEYYGAMWTPLTVASIRGCVRVVELLLGAGANVYLNEALVAAAGASCMEVVKMILNAGADINARIERDGETRTALTAASKIGEPGNGRMVVKWLLEAGANVDLNEALVEAAAGGSTKAAKLIIDAGADINAWAEWEGNRCTALAAAERMGEKRMVEWLLKAGANTGLDDLDDLDDALRPVPGQPHFIPHHQRPIEVQYRMREMNIIYYCP